MCRDSVHAIRTFPPRPVSLCSRETGIRNHIHRTIPGPSLEHTFCYSGRSHGRCRPVSSGSGRQRLVVKPRKPFPLSRISPGRERFFGAGSSLPWRRSPLGVCECIYDLSAYNISGDFYLFRLPTTRVFVLQLGIVGARVNSRRRSHGRALYTLSSSSPTFSSTSLQMLRATQHCTTLLPRDTGALRRSSVDMSSGVAAFLVSNGPASGYPARQEIAPVR
ncbi:hypothetical protein BD309DRAFT_339494 [Dichomitus squalens]|uniref:Uncharacterized protein n=1 Tax=Dichomitus squalens TaxID=114155 RepID=A0A4Q9Q0J2_9APHY|nr:hypothetical protein BD311DRAFT_217289 [Dichomitus squalens]TBU40561.1 hypothetical protein BD309DRAFT_339494 [Dichomitus squalens]TBU60535.1 hypothetical protein BD310DRAFT_321060 [Dichomitus squalens]